MKLEQQLLQQGMKLEQRYWLTGNEVRTTASWSTDQQDQQMKLEQQLLSNREWS